MMLGLLCLQYLSPVLRHAGDLPADPNVIEETAETPMAGD
jgi:hypothetical protein